MLWNNYEYILTDYTSDQCVVNFDMHDPNSALILKATYFSVLFIYLFIYFAATAKRSIVPFTTIYAPIHCTNLFLTLEF